MYIEITDNFEVKEIAKDIRNYRFCNDITVQELSNLVEELSPDNYMELHYRDVLENVKGELPDELVNVLTSSRLNLDHIISAKCKLSDAMVQDIIDNHLSTVDAEYLISFHNLSFEQFKTVVNNGTNIYASSLASAIGHSRNVEYALYVVRNRENIDALRTDDDINIFRYNLYNDFGSVLLSDSECRELFGFVRPAFSSIELRDQSPCTEGWKRAYKWAGRTDTKYSWNEFIARHVLANQDNVEDAKADLDWLAESLSDDHDYFDYW